jgi:alpha-tubulin suppressor-like RCC1 family protein
MKKVRWTASLPLLAAGLLAALGCREDAEPPTGPEPSPADATVTTHARSFRQVSAGAAHTCGVTTSNLAYCWGSNDEGQLGDGTRTRRLRPVAVAGGRHFVQISAGGVHTCAVTDENRAYCWGDNNDGQLGNGNTTTGRSTPGVISGHRFRQIHAGFHHTCGINTSNVAFCWGNNDLGQLGTGGFRTTTPVRVARGLRWRQVIAGASHTCGATTDNKGYCWGDNGFGQLGDGTRTGRSKPALIAGGLAFRQVVPGGGFFFESGDESLVDDGHTCGLTTADKAYCWGLNLGSGGGRDFLRPVEVAGGRRYRFINTGQLHVCAVTLSNVAFCWGSNGEGQLGVGSGTSHSSSPVRVAGGLAFSAVSAGTLGYHNCAWTTTGRAYCWGRNTSGQLGDGTTTTRLRPVAVAGP